MANILAVNDDEKIRELLSTLLKRKGHHVLTADHGLKGIDVFRRERPHVTILDFEIPDIDGARGPAADPRDCPPRSRHHADRRWYGGAGEAGSGVRGD